MNYLSVGSPVPVTRIGSTAHALLKAGCRGHVLASFTNVTYLLTSSRQLFWATSAGAPLHRRCLQASEVLPRSEGGMPFVIRDGQLKIEPGLTLDAASAEQWRTPQIHRGRVIRLDEVARRVGALAAELDLSQARGLAGFLPDILHFSSGSAPPVDEPVLTHARPAVLDAAFACRDRDWRRLSQAADALIGLGTGLTPSGDDFIGGVLFAARLLRHAYPGFAIPATAIVDDAYRARTNLISFTMLADLAEGHAIEPLHLIAAGILEGQLLAALQSAIQRLARVGHSTGWDMLSGLLTGFMLAGD